MGKAKIELVDVVKYFPSPKRGVENNKVLAGLSLAAARGSFIFFVGPSGCGKTTLLRLVAGFDTPSHGQVLIDGKVVRDIQHDMGMVFQTHSLYPWLTVRENIRFGLRVSNKFADDVERQIVEEMLELVDLKDFGDAYSKTLSGGMRQRVALARSLAIKPSLLLLDEPFGALDAQTRMVLQDQLISIWEGFDTTIFAVTHDIEEALLLADVIYVLSARPATIMEKVINPFASARKPSLRSDPKFISKKMEIFEHMREATEIAMKGI